MPSVDVTQTIDLVVEYVKVNSLLMKLNKLIRYHLSDKSILEDDEDEPVVVESDNAEVQQYATLRKTISTLHDRIFNCFRNLSVAEKQEVFDFIDKKTTSYSEELEALNAQVGDYYTTINSGDRVDHNDRVVAISMISKAASRKEEVEGYLRSYSILKSYIGVLKTSGLGKK